MDAEGEGKDSFDLRPFKNQTGRFRSDPAILGNDVGDEELFDSLVVGGYERTGLSIGIVLLRSAAEPRNRLLLFRERTAVADFWIFSERIAQIEDRMQKHFFEGERERLTNRPYIQAGMSFELMNRLHLVVSDLQFFQN